MNRKPNTADVCDKFKNGNLVLEFKEINNYSTLGVTIINLIRGIKIISDFQTEGCKDERLNVINELSNIVISMDCYEELNHLETIIKYNKLELSKDKETANLLEQIKFNKESSNYYKNEYENLKKIQNETSN
ncbi:hypothetical protein [Flavobacterium psychrophilum]|uniref:Uncharacterized protein n=1 Tax=Flavobacterium psychrophilum TaxID=96345 RepID=A0A7U2NFD4_FLAPS|nr:hypothetical protein [Flavobacterium psychrophilum]OAE92118.1 hypothetical protein SU65_10200 [Flavobacterium psychrophilum]QRE04186.1 hypothetical protein H0H26_00845 [Flavobacterium psychrophilum]